MLADVLQQRLSVLQAVMAVTLLGVMGIFFLLLLGLARRRYLHHRLKDKPTEPVPDIWHESGRRLADQLDKGLVDDEDKPAQDEPPLRRPTFLDDLDKLPPDAPDKPPPQGPDDDDHDDSPQGGGKPRQ